MLPPSVDRFAKGMLPIDEVDDDEDIQRINSRETCDGVSPQLAPIDMAKRITIIACKHKSRQREEQCHSHIAGFHKGLKQCWGSVRRTKMARVNGEGGQDAQACEGGKPRSRLNDRW